MKIDFSCPVELLHVGYKDGKASFFVNNLSENMLISIEVEAATYDADGYLLDMQKNLFGEISVFYKEPKEFAFDIENPDEVDYVDIEILSLRFEKGIAWHSGVLNDFNYTVDVLEGEELHALKLIAGEDAIAYPSEQGDLWVCVCGRANRVDDAFCVRCDRERENLFQNITKERAKEARSALEHLKIEENRQAVMAGQKIKDKQQERAEHNKKRRQMQTRFAIVGLALAVLIVLGVLFGLPYYNSVQADKLIERGEYEAAIAQLEKLPANYNVENRIKAVRYRMATELFESNTAESLAQAKQMFVALGDYEQSADYAMRCDYQQAELLMVAEGYEAAINIYTSISGYADSALKIQEAKYRLAVKMLENENYEDAKTAFTELGNYLDSMDRIHVCDYQLGIAALEAENYESAVDYLDAAIGYLDAEEKYFEANYGLANQYYAEQRFAEAGKCYLVASQSKYAAEKYPDALTKARLTLYQQGKIALAGSDYTSAAEIFGSISGYLDADNLYMQAQVAIANRALNDGDIDTALSILSEFEGQESASAVSNRAKYAKAEAVLGEGNKEEAARLFSEIIPYSDSQTRYLAISYSIAEDQLEQGEYDAAIEGFLALGAYSDSVSRANESKYSKAQSLFEAGSFEEAAQIFLGLGSYSDAQAKAQEAVISAAKEHVEKKEYDKAEALVESIANLEGADDMLAEIRYIIASAYIEQNEYEKALQLLNRIENYKDVDTLKQQMAFLTAEELANKEQSLRAARLYASLGDYRDAALRAEQLYNTVYEAAAQAARTHQAAKEYDKVYETLKDLDLSDLPAKYEDLLNLYRSAVYTLANEAYDRQDAFVAYAYYQLIPDYQDVESRLTAWTYRIIGRWTTADGILAIFNEDGTATVNGTNYGAYFVDGYTLRLGASAAELETLYNMSNRGSTAFTLRERNGDRRSYVYSRVVQSTPEAQDNTDDTPGTLVPIPISIDE